MGFREEFARFSQPSPEREAFVLKTLTSLPREQVVGNLKPVTVSKPDGSRITYQVMPDYIKVDGIRVPMSGVTAQKVADHFGMNLPTPQMVNEIYQNADVKVPAKPLSGTGTNVDGKQYSGSEVVGKGVGYAPFVANYNANIDKQLNEQGAKEGQIVAGFAKDIVPPAKPGALGLYGLFDANGKPIQGGNGQTPHEVNVHSEYGTFVRLIGPTVQVRTPDGRNENKPLGEVYQYARYTPAKEKGDHLTPSNESAVAEYTPEKPQSGRLQLLQRIDSFLSQFNQKA